MPPDGLSTDADQKSSSAKSVAASDPRLHFGLGKATKAEKVVILWPSGLIETLSDPPANQYYVVREGNGVDTSKTHGVSSVRIQISTVAK
jgi:ASPIC and UnbV